MKNTVNLNSLTLVNADSLEFIKTLPDNCIDLIATDPPYFRVKKNSWDNQWSSEDQYLKWLDEMFVEFWRVLKPAGSLYVFCGWRLASHTELLMRDRFDVLNHIIWAKPSGRWNGCRKEDLRSYFPATEHILFAQHYAGPCTQKTDVYSSKCTDLKRDVFRPLIDYFRNARAALKVTSKDINAATGKQMASHWFSDSQWQLPSEEDYGKLQSLFSRLAVEQQQHHQLDKPHGALADDYVTLSRQYSELAEEYEKLRRPFSVSAFVPYTDVWTYPPVQFYPGKHPCEKPAEMMSDIISASSRPGDVVADFFMGSGVTIKEALKLGRKGLGVELEEDRFQQTEREISNIPF
ncbi:DNA adenine methylase [Lonsdalea britannica]|uniref:DNA-methyltransferase n=1 Tax=Lonsdalea britannica TaxID=1082704 RepID=UPI000A1FA789|nr:site-specific DNA-methyltransferase [Lonsdalea britannica]OSN08370.1 DNA adenine methylase [Lonsdalea britannica]